MTDNESSSEPATAAAGTPGAANGGAAGDLPQFGSFGATKGSGLARGKRPGSASAAHAPAAPIGEYKPTALEVIKPQREYQNPFGDPAPVAEPSASVPSEVSAPEPVATPAPAAVVEAPAAVPAPSAAAANAIEEAAAPAPEAQIAPPAQSVEEQASLKILPPAEEKRPKVAWESSTARPAPAPAAPSGNRREDRPYQRRDDRPSGHFEPRREHRPESREPRPLQAPRPASPRPEAQAPAPASKSGGLFGWIKGLFGAKAAAPAPQAPAGTPDGRPERDDEGPYGQRRRRRRGGRGRHFDGPAAGPNPNQPSPDSNRPSYPREDGRDQSQGGGGGRRRRRRGGRGRFRGPDGGDPRPEGHQGGGAI